MRFRIVLYTLLCASAACGNQIGDDCATSTDCSTTQDRICDRTSTGGYCTILGCDVGTCPEEAVCVRFFPVSSSNRTCDPAAEDRGMSACSPDEICTLGGSCAPRNSEIHYCMKKCGGDGDCRDGYECRDESLMKEHGGEPVPDIGDAIGSKLDRFCAVAP